MIEGEELNQLRLVIHPSKDKRGGREGRGRDV